MILKTSFTKYLVRLQSCIQTVEIYYTISFSILQLFELSPPHLRALGKLLQNVQIIQHNRLA